MSTFTSAGAVQTSPTALRDELVAVATALSPGLTTNLPASLIEDLSSTATGALVVQNSAFVDLVNSVSPLTANDFIMTGLGNVYGVQHGVGSNTSVYVTFTGTPGFAINAGFIVSDGTYQYTVQDGGVIGTAVAPATTGVSPALYCLATVAGSWAVPIDTVTQLITSVPSTVTLSCTNATVGLAGATAQTTQEYRAQVIQAGQAVSTGMVTFLKTTLANVSGVQPRLISVRTTGGGWQVLVGGGDPYSVAYAIYLALFNILDLKPAAAGGTTQTVAIYDFPDVYQITYVTPVQQSVQVNVSWSTVAGSNLVSNSVISSLVQPAMVAYINSIYVGQPISVLELDRVFQEATAASLSLATLSRLTFVVSIDGTVVSPPANGVLIAGNAEGYFFSTTANIVVTKV